MPADEAQAHARGESVAARTRRPTPIATREDTVNETEARQLREENARLKERIAALEFQLPAQIRERAAVARTAPRVEASPADLGDVDALYAEFKRRLLVEPAVLRVLSLKPTIDVETKRETVRVDGTSWLGRVAGLVADGFFDSPQRSGVAYREAVRRGATGIAARADEACKKLLAMGFLTREDEGYKAVKGMQVNIVETGA
jgi:hypothetical protein